MVVFGHEEFAVHFGDLVEHDLHFLEEYFAFEGLFPFFGVVCAFGAQGCELVGLGVGLGVVDEAVAGDAEEPGGEEVGVSQFIQVFGDFEEDVLGEVEGYLGVFGHAEAVVVDAVEISLVQFAQEQGVMVVLVGCYQLGYRDVVQICWQKGGFRVHGYELMGQM